MIGILPFLTTALFSEIPGTQGNAVNGGVAGGEAGAGGAGTGDPAQAGPGAPGVASPGQPSPQDANQVIEDAKFYILNPNDPVGSRTMGLNLREAMVRAGQFDTVQSQMHQTQTRATGLEAENAQLKARLAEFERQNSIMSTLQQMGVQLPDRGSVYPDTHAGLPNPTGPGVQTPQGIQQEPGQQDYTGVTNQWRVDANTEGAYGLNQDPQGVSQGMPNAPGTQNIPGMQNVPGAQPGQQRVPSGQTVQPSQQPPASFDPVAFAQALTPVLQNMVNAALGNVDQKTNQMVQQNFQKMQEQQTLQDQISSAFTGSRATRAQKLRLDGLPEDRILNILDLEDGSYTLQRQAEALYQAGDSQSIALGHEKLRQSEALRAQAMEDRVNGKLQFQELRQRETYENLINQDPYRALGVEPQKDLSYDLTDPRAIEQAVQGNFDKALEMANAQERVNTTTGGFP